MSARIPLPPASYDVTQFMRIVLAIEQRLAALESAYATGYTVDNPPTSPARSLDASSASTDDVRDVLATLIADLKTRGRLG